MDIKLSFIVLMFLVNNLECIVGDECYYIDGWQGGASPGFPSPDFSRQYLLPWPGRDWEEYTVFPADRCAQRCLTDNHSYMIIYVTFDERRRRWGLECRCTGSVTGMHRVSGCPYNCTHPGDDAEFWCVKRRILEEATQQSSTNLPFTAVYLGSWLPLLQKSGVSMTTRFRFSSTPAADTSSIIKVYTETFTLPTVHTDYRNNSLSAINKEDAQLGTIQIVVISIVAVFLTVLLISLTMWLLRRGKAPLDQRPDEQNTSVTHYNDAMDAHSFSSFNI